MGLIADVLRLRNQVPVPLPQYQSGSTSAPYSGFHRLSSAYTRNEIVYSAIELLASSAGEPHICGRRWRRNSPTVSNPRAVLNEMAYDKPREAIRVASKLYRGAGPVNALLVKNGYVEELPAHPLVEMLNAPNPFMSRGQFWGTAVMDRALAGNFYALKARASGYPNSMPIELWRLRPDRVTIIPSKVNYIEAYEYDSGEEKIRFLPKDVMHWKSRNPLNDYYGMPALMPILGRLDIDWYMQNFLKQFFERGGSGPGAILTVKQRLSEQGKLEVKDRFKRQFGGAGGTFELMVLDQADTTYQSLGLDRGLRDALPKELDAVSEARIAMVFGVPGSIIGLLIGYESSSYANKDADYRVYWKLTMVPMLSDADDVLNLSLTPEFTGVDEVYFDLDDIEALQPDVDLVQERTRKNFAASLTSFEESRDELGYDPAISEGMFYVPKNGALVPFDELGETSQVAPPATPEGVPTGAEPVLAPPNGNTPQAIIAEPRCPKCNRRNGANIQEGGSLTCQRCREDFVVA